MTRIHQNTIEQPGPAWASGRAWVVLLIVTILGLAADLASKRIAFATVADVPVHIDRARVLATDPGRLGRLLPHVEPVSAIPNVLDFTLVLNPGAVFGIGAGRRWFFMVFTLLAIGFGLWMFGMWTTRRSHSAHVAIGLLLAGGLGNLYDRIAFACVRDFIHPLPGLMLPFGWRWPITGEREVWPYVSNVADALLIVGIAILMIHSLRSPKHEQRDDQPASGTDSD